MPPGADRPGDAAVDEDVAELEELLGLVVASGAVGYRRHDVSQNHGSGLEFGILEVERGDGMYPVDVAGCGTDASEKELAGSLEIPH